MKHAEAEEKLCTTERRVRNGGPASRAWLTAPCCDGRCRLTVSRPAYYHGDFAYLHHGMHLGRGMALKVLTGDWP